VIARLTSQKGLDLIEQIIPRLMEMDLQLVILGTGDPPHEANLRTLQARYPGRIGLRIGFDEGLAHRIEGGADIFVMPSRYEPCGLSQLYSLRYGTVPIVTRTGGLIDTVVPLNPETLRTGSATGFHVEAMTPKALLDAVRAAVSTYGRPEMWNQLVKTGMKYDVSWGRSAKSYESLFVSLIDE
jgi:starch synthase